MLFPTPNTFNILIWTRNYYPNPTIMKPFRVLFVIKTEIHMFLLSGAHITQFWSFYHLNSINVILTGRFMTLFYKMEPFLSGDLHSDRFLYAIILLIYDWSSINVRIFYYLLLLIQLLMVILLCLSILLELFSMMADINGDL